MSNDRRGTLHDHVELLITHDAAGAPMLEPVPATRLDNGLFELTASPGLVMGCAAGDVVHVGPGGRFVVEERGPNHCVHVYPTAAFSEDVLQRLESEIDRMDGVTVEAPPSRRFAVVTMPRSGAPERLENVLNALAETVEVYWEYTTRESGSG